MLPAGDGALAAWENALAATGLDGPGFSGRLDAFDAYLDGMEETLDEWGQANGI